MAASSVAVRRLGRELDSLRKSGNPQLAVQPSPDDLLIWHFVLHSLPTDTPYAGGFYHGRLVFPPTYPHAPPSIFMVTPSGRLETGKRLCLSMSDWHPESWNPAWSVETILVGLLSFFISDSERGYGAICAPLQRRKQLAVESAVTNAQDREFCELFGEFVISAKDNVEQACPAMSSVETASVPVAESLAGQTVLPPALSPPQGNMVASSVPLAAEASAVAPVNTASDLASEANIGTEQGATTMISAVNTEDVSRAIAAASDSMQQSSTAEDAEPTECWICRDDTSLEPLVYPCACRGSMSGVHASCVEEWIRAHTRTAVNDDPPRCGVCQQPYHGDEQRPGAWELLRQWATATINYLPSLVCLLFRLVLFLCYLSVTEKTGDANILAISEPVPLIPRVLIISAFLAVMAYKTTLLTVSLPLHRERPRNRFAQHFFVPDFQAFILHVYEVLWAVTISVCEMLKGSLPFLYFLPVSLMILIPCAKIIVAWRMDGRCGLRQCLKITVAVLMSPILVLCLCVGLPCLMMWRYRKHLVHPLAAGPHIVIIVTTYVLSFECQSNVPIVAVQAVHTVFSALGLIEFFFVKRWHWYTGIVWLVALEFLWLHVYFMLIGYFIFPSGIGSPHYSSLVAKLVTVVWACIVTLLITSIHYELARGHIVHAYRTWQHRNGTFRLQAHGQASREGLARPQHEDGHQGNIAPAEEV
eukprot:TRINITY_DN42331_c0_g1_i1.p1 TRINITY_DN42331_c0_g1~~TRINITY_DN42331_c0_g1_i1.p1  ORF type:complete len:733 (-),score=55.51 TRINITY_DN42331_c0_g1_i1:94-2199(-)